MAAKTSKSRSSGTRKASTASSQRKRSTSTSRKGKKAANVARSIGTDYAPNYEVMADGAYTKVTSEEDAFVGRFVDVVGGEHKGRYGVLLSIASVNEDGSPDKAIVRTRDNDTLRLTCDYHDLRPAEAGGRR